MPDAQDLSPAPRPAYSERDLRILRGFAQRIDAADAGAHNNLGVLYERRGRLAEAIAHYKRALALNPSLADARLNLARFQQKPKRSGSG